MLVVLSTYLWMLQRAMQRFTEKIVGLMKSENLFESQGGPIILSQVQVLGLWLFNFNVCYHLLHSGCKFLCNPD